MVSPYLEVEAVVVRNCYFQDHFPSSLPKAASCAECGSFFVNFLNSISLAAVSIFWTI